MFTASYSILSLWEKGDTERAIKSYFKLEEYTSDAMQYGKQKHQEWADYILKESKTPPELGAITLSNPKVETRFTMPLARSIELTGILDCYDDQAFYDWKTGQTESNTWARSYQMPLYALLLMAHDLFRPRGVIIHHDAVTGKTDSTHILIGDSTLENAAEWAVALATDMNNHLEKHKLYEQYQSRRDQAKAAA